MKKTNKKYVVIRVCNESIDLDRIYDKKKSASDYARQKNDYIKMLRKESLGNIYMGYNDSIYDEFLDFCIKKKFEKFKRNRKLLDRSVLSEEEQKEFNAFFNENEDENLREFLKKEKYSETCIEGTLMETLTKKYNYEMDSQRFVLPADYYNE